MGVCRRTFASLLIYNCRWKPDHQAMIKRAILQSRPRSLLSNIKTSIKFSLCLLISETIFSLNWCQHFTHSAPDWNVLPRPDNLHKTFWCKIVEGKVSCSVSLKKCFRVLWLNKHLSSKSRFISNNNSKDGNYHFIDFESVFLSVSERLNVLYEKNWTRLVTEQLKRFERAVTESGKREVNGGTVGSRWTFSGALLYSITLLTTVGERTIFISLLDPRVKLLFFLQATVDYRPERRLAKWWRSFMPSLVSP